MRHAQHLWHGIPAARQEEESQHRLASCATMGMVKIGGDAVIEKVDQRKYGALYRRCIERDFARNERRPLFLIRSLHERGMYDFLALRDDATGRLLAYAGLLYAPGVDAMLLDYLAVEPEYRDKGVGSRFMRELATYCTAGGILIECETPALAKDAEEQAIRERRVGFYKKNRAVDTGEKWHFFGVGYDLLWLPIQKQLAEVDVRRDISTLYSQGTPRWMARLAVHVMGGNAKRH